MYLVLIKLLELPKPKQNKNDDCGYKPSRETDEDN